MTRVAAGGKSTCVFFAPDGMDNEYVFKESVGISTACPGVASGIGSTG